MANIDDGFWVDILSLSDLTIIVAGDIDPSAGAGETAPTGSLYTRQYSSATAGDLFIKTGVADTDWDRYLPSSDIDDLITPVTDDLTALEQKVNNMIASGAYYNSDGTFNPLPINIRLGNVSVGPTDDLLEVLEQLDDAITNLPVSLVGLTDTVITAPTASQALVYNDVSGVWENQTIAIPAPAPGSGRVVQLFTGNIINSAGTLSIPIDNTIPSVTEGFPVWSQAVTPTDVGSIVRINTMFSWEASQNNFDAICTVFRDGVCIGSALTSAGRAAHGVVAVMTLFDIPAVTSEVVYSVRWGKRDGQGGTWYMNRTAASATILGGTLEASGWSLEEIAL
jgi:hypothetical protein